MIRVNFTYNQDLLRRYTDLIITPLEQKCLGLLNNVPELYSDNLRNLITGEGLTELILIQPSELIPKINDVYRLVPILAERYCLEFTLRSFDLNTEFITLNISSNASKQRIREYKQIVIEQLNDLFYIDDTIIISNVVTTLDNTNVASEIKSCLKRLNNFKSGNYVLNPSELELFDDWVHTLADIFDYDSMAKRFASELTQALNINVCPYCNYEDTETFGDDNCTTRPDLDHFHPKAKFPFLSLTLSNLLPAGEKCNRKYKSDKVMLDYRNPYIEGISDLTLFDFDYPIDQDLAAHNIEVRIISDTNFNQNFELFNFTNVYNKKDIKETFIDIFKRNRYRKSLDESAYATMLNDVESINYDLNVDLTVSIKDRSLQKFKIDTLRKVTGRHFSAED